jgi:hypothetical protein
MTKKKREETVVLDTPNQIKDYQCLAALHGVKMEIRMQEHYGFPPTACPTRGLGRVGIP